MGDPTEPASRASAGARVVAVTMDDLELAAILDLELWARWCPSFAQLQAFIAAQL